MKVVYVEGDSTTYGWVDQEMGGWANRLHVKTLNEEVAGFDDVTMVYNRSMPGRTLSRVLNEAGANMRFYRGMGATAAVLQAGMNEGKTYHPDRGPVVPVARFGREIVAFCDLARQHDCSPILVGPPPIDPAKDGLPAYGGAIIRDQLLVEYGDIMRDAARREGATYVDTRAVFAETGRPLTELVSPDGYHPNAMGHAALADAVYAALPFTN